LSLSRRDCDDGGGEETTSLSLPLPSNPPEEGSFIIEFLDITVFCVSLFFFFSHFCGEWKEWLWLWGDGIVAVGGVGRRLGIVLWAL